MKAPDCHVRGSNLGAVCDFLTRLNAELKESFHDAWPESRAVFLVVMGRKPCLSLLTLGSHLRHGWFRL